MVPLAVSPFEGVLEGCPYSPQVFWGVTSHFSSIHSEQGTW